MNIASFPSGAKSSVYEGLSTIEVVTNMHPQDNLSCYRRIDKSCYVDTSTGELREYCIKSESVDKTAWLRKSMTKLRRLIDCNFTCDNSELFLTLTFSETTSYDEARKSFTRFWERFRYHHKDCGYIMIVEPHENGNWHIHVLVKNHSGRIYVHHSELYELWRHGSVHVERIPFQDFGMYFMKRDKLKRANYYPSNVKLFTASRSMIRPVAITMSHDEAMDRVRGSQIAIYEKKPIYAGDNQVNTIIYEKYYRRNTK